MLAAYDLACPVHGLWHACFHEAGHAVAAIDGGIAFKHVAILPADQRVEYRGGLITGGVWLVEESPSTWVRSEPVAALRFCLAGSLTEEAILGHSLTDGYLGDVDIWRRGAGLIGANLISEMEAMLGRPLHSVVEETRLWVTGRSQAIRNVVAAMTGIADGPFSRVELWQCRSMSEAEVRTLARQMPPDYG